MNRAARVLWLVAALAACGVKAPPRPPEAQPAPTPAPAEGDRTR